MALSLSCETREGLLLGRISGPFRFSDLVASTQSIIDQAGAANFETIVVDLTAVHRSPSTLERWDYGQFVAAASLRSQPTGKSGRFRMVFLAHPPLIDPGKFGETVAHNRGADLKVTSSLDEAAQWLGVGVEALRAPPP
jgi:hypothetical protein